MKLFALYSYLILLRTVMGVKMNGLASLIADTVGELSSDTQIPCTIYVHDLSRDLTRQIVSTPHSSTTIQVLYVVS